MGEGSGEARERAREREVRMAQRDVYNVRA